MLTNESETIPGANTGTGYVCPYCGIWVPSMTYHVCSGRPILQENNACVNCPFAGRCSRADIPACFEEKK